MKIKMKINQKTGLYTPLPETFNTDEEYVKAFSKYYFEEVKASIHRNCEDVLGLEASFMQQINF